MNSSPAALLDSDQNLQARVLVLEHQHRGLLDMAAQTLAEVRAVREDIREFKGAIVEELGRVYAAVAPSDS